MNNPLLPYSILSSYDMAKVTKRVNEVYDLFGYLKTAVPDFCYPLISCIGRVRYEQFIKGVNSSKLENFVIDKLFFELRGNEYKRKLFATKVTIALRTLNIDEVLVFKKLIYEGKEVIDLCDEIGYCESKIREIRKSAFVKFLMALNIDQDCLKGGDKLRVQSYFQNKAGATL